MKRRQTYRPLGLDERDTGMSEQETLQTAGCPFPDSDLVRTDPALPINTIPTRPYGLRLELAQPTPVDTGELTFEWAQTTEVPTPPPILAPRPAPQALQDAFIASEPVALRTWLMLIGILLLAGSTGAALLIFGERALRTVL